MNSTSTNGGAVAVGGGNITYTPVTNFAGADQISRTLTDSRGGSVTGNVFVAGPPAFTGLNLAVDRSSFALAGTGVARQAYVLQTATNLAPPTAWVSMYANTAGTNGIFNFTDTPVTNFNQGFYRVMKS